MSEMSKQLLRFLTARSRFLFLHGREGLHRCCPTNAQNDRVYASVVAEKRDVSASRLLRVHTPYVQPLCDNVGDRL